MKFNINLKYCLLIILLLMFFIGCNSTKSKFGLYKSYFPNFSVELQSNGNVFLTPKQGNRIYCSTKGSWTEIGETSIQIDLEVNDGCEWVREFSGSWTLNECNTFEGEKTYCLEKGNYKLIKN